MRLGLARVAGIRGVITLTGISSVTRISVVLLRRQPS